MKIGMTYDLRGDYLAMGFTPHEVAEFDEARTIDAIERTIRELGHEPDRIGHVKALAARLVKGDRWDLVFNIAEGVKGRSREAQVPALLEAYDIPYTFSDPLVCAVTLDKAVAKRIVASHGLRTPAFHVVEDAASLAKLATVKLSYPLFAKPIAEGTGKGISARSRIDNHGQLAEVCGELLEAHRQPVLVEEYLPGREFTTAIVGTGHKARAIGTMEIVVKKTEHGSIYSYETKEECETLIEYRHTKPCETRTEVEKLAVDCYAALECRDGGRVDIRLDAHGKASFMEVNPLAGLNPGHSDLPMIAEMEGMSYRELLGYIIASAAKRIAPVK